MLGDWGARENDQLIGKIATCISSKKWCPYPEFSTKLGRFPPPSSARCWRTTFSTPPAAHGGRGKLTEHADLIWGGPQVGVLPYDYSKDLQVNP